MKKTLCSALALLLLLPLSACGDISAPEAGPAVDPPETVTLDHGSIGTVTVETERLIRGCTHILLAEYAGTVPAYAGEERVFLPLEVWKGELQDKRIYVQGEDPMLRDRELRPGDRVILAANRHISVYYPHDLYTLACALETWEADRAWVDSVLDGAPTPEREYYGEAFSDSEELLDILSLTECAFVVKASDQQDKGGNAPSVICRCSVRQSLLGEPVSREIYVVFFQDTVEAGEEYLVLLRNVDGGVLYTLSSRKSVFPAAEAWGNGELMELLEKAAAAAAPEALTYEDVLTAEGHAADLRAAGLE